MLMVLTGFWMEYNISIWAMNKEFTSFKGDELKVFILNTTSIVSWLTKQFERVGRVDDICECLILWEKISEFMNITDVNDSEKYLRQMRQNEENVKTYYQRGGFFLTDKSSGDDETFYMHVMRYYVPHIAKLTFERHKCGVGVFTMQGFERRNKESKQMF